MQPASRSVTGMTATVVTRKRVAATSVVARVTKKRRVEQDTLGESWRKALQAEFSKPYFLKSKTIYSWSRLTSLESVKVVVLGQDPYHNTGQAHGLSFSVLPPTKLPGSLKNIYKQLSMDVPAFKPPLIGDLTPLARAGVLWLNTCLTVRAHTPNSHSKKGWESFTDAVIKAVLDREDDRGVVFFAWGLPAQKPVNAFGVEVGGFATPNREIFNTHELSPVDLLIPPRYQRTVDSLETGHFKKANEWLRKTNDSEIRLDSTVFRRT
ncbi:uracil-DNA glycosylase [Pisolithus marmoratus]|nr:uracil-DNA glycosylase [Pisolithus marmoratus]